MLKPLAVALFVGINLSLSSCSTNIGGLLTNSTGSSKSPKTTILNDGLIKYTSLKGYEFVHPKDWKSMDAEQIPKSLDTAFINKLLPSERLFVDISKAPANKTMVNMDSPPEVGYFLVKGINKNPKLKREAGYIDAKSREAGGKTYYNVVYTLKLPNNQVRYNIVSMVISDGKRYNLNSFYFAKQLG